MACARRHPSGKMDADEDARVAPPQRQAQALFSAACALHKGGSVATMEETFARTACATYGYDTAAKDAHVDLARLIDELDMFFTSSSGSPKWQHIQGRLRHVAALYSETVDVSVKLACRGGRCTMCGTEEHRSMEVVHAVGHPTYDSVDFLTDDLGELETAFSDYCCQTRATYLGCFIAGDSCTKNLLRAFAAKELIRDGIADAHAMLDGSTSLNVAERTRAFVDELASRIEAVRESLRSPARAPAPALVDKRAKWASLEAMCAAAWKIDVDDRAAFLLRAQSSTRTFLLTLDCDLLDMCGYPAFDVDAAESAPPSPLAPLPPRKRKHYRVLDSDDDGDCQCLQPAQEEHARWGSTNAPTGPFATMAARQGACGALNAPAPPSRRARGLSTLPPPTHADDAMEDARAPDGRTLREYQAAGIARQRDSDVLLDIGRAACAATSAGSIHVAQSLHVACAELLEALLLRDSGQRQPEVVRAAKCTALQARLAGVMEAGSLAGHKNTLAFGVLLARALLR